MRNQAILLLLAFTTMVAAQQKVVCYYGSWATYRPGAGKFDVEDIDPNICTHLIYTFIDVDENGNIIILDPQYDIVQGGFQRFNNLRLINPNVKTMIAIGGWNANSTIYSMVVGDPVTRTNFANNLYDFVKLHGFNGLDLDWEYPAQRGGAPEDKENFVLLLRELRQLFNPEGLVLAAAVGADPSYTVTSYDVPELAANLDFISLMTYDFHGSWDNVTGIHCALHPYSGDPNNPTYNVEGTVQHWRQAGAPGDKLIIGIPLYGRSFTLEDPTQIRIGSPTTGGGDPGPYTRTSGSLGYNELCEMLNPGGWTEVWALEAESAVAIRDTQWVSYDNYEAARLKAVFAVNRLLAGAMVWSVDTDDFRNTCGMGRYPLLTVIYNTLNG